MSSNSNSNINIISSTKSSSSSSDQEEEETDASSSSSSLIPSSHLLSSQQQQLLPPKKYIKEQRGNKNKNKNKMIRNPDYDEYMKKAAKQRIMHDDSISIVDDSSINCSSTTSSATSAIINRTDTANKIAAITSTRRNSRSIEDNVVEDEYDIPNDIPPPANKKEDTEISATACNAIREDESAAAAAAAEDNVDDDESGIPPPVNKNKAEIEVESETEIAATACNVEIEVESETEIAATACNVIRDDDSAAADGTSTNNNNHSKNNNNNTIIYDLSKDFPIHNNGKLNNPGSKMVELNWSKERSVRRLTVIENGKIVIDYRRNDVGIDDIYNLFSCTKAMISLLIGVVIQQTDLQVTDTLKDIFKDNHNYAWSLCILNSNSLNEYPYKSSIRLEELLTHTSGLKSMFGGKGLLNMKTISIADASGSDLPTSLLAPAYDCKLRGKFHYMASTNILSYIIKEKTGLSPRQFGAKYVFPLLGIDNTKLKWDQNNDGIETSFSQLKVTTIMMCKVAQLYLQEGYPSPEVKVPLLSKEYIKLTQSKHVYAKDGYDSWLGYLWFLYDHEYHKNNQVGNVWAVPGLHGQVTAYYKKTNRVVSISRSTSPYTPEWLIRYKRNLIKLLSPSISFHPLRLLTDEPKKFIPDELAVGGPDDGSTKKMIRNPLHIEYMKQLMDTRLCNHDNDDDDDDSCIIGSNGTGRNNNNNSNKLNNMKCQSDDFIYSNNRRPGAQRNSITKNPYI